MRARGRKKEERKLKGMEGEGGRRVSMKVDTWDGERKSRTQGGGHV